MERGLFGTRIDALLRSMGKTVGLVLLQHVSYRECLQIGHADVMGVFVSVSDKQREIFDPHIVVHATMTCGRI